MEIIFLVGRILFGIFFVILGVNHFKKLGQMTQYAASKNVPSPRLATIITGILLVFGGLGVVLGIYVTLSLWLLVIFLVPTAFIMHNFWATPEEEKMTQMINFLRNIALAGASLMLLSLPLPWDLSIL